MAESDLLRGIALLFAVLGAIGAWFHRCGRADKERRLRPFAKRTLLLAGAGFVVGVAFLTSDFGSARPEERLGSAVLTIGCFLLVYAAASAMIAADDDSLVMVNLTGKGLLLTVPELAPFYTLPAPQQEPAAELPPILPRTYYVVSAELGRRGAQAGRSDLFTVDEATATACHDTGHLRVRRLFRVAPAAAPAEQPQGVVRA
jgi:hypothetical protein